PGASPPRTCRLRRITRSSGGSVSAGGFMAALLPILVLVAVLASDLWVYADAKEPSRTQHSRGVLLGRLQGEHANAMVLRLLVAVDRVLPALRHRATPLSTPSGISSGRSPSRCSLPILVRTHD